MAKRFTDTEKWKKRWFRLLSNDHKVFWQYLLDNCNHAGIWEVDFELAYIFCSSINELEIRKSFEKQYQELDGGKRWFIRDFIDFQYGTLNPNNNLHKSVMAILEKSGASQGLISPSQGGKDKVLVRATVKVKDLQEQPNSIILSKEQTYDVFEESILEVWHEFCKKYPIISDIKEISEKRRKSLKCRFSNKSFRDIKSILEAIEKQPFLLGSNDRKWKISFDWLIENDTNYLKVLENKYGGQTIEEMPKKAKPDCQVCNGVGYLQAQFDGKKTECKCLHV